MLHSTTIVADGNGKDTIETIFFVIVVAISIFGSLIGKLLKRNDDVTPELTIDESVFGGTKETLAEDDPPPPTPDNYDILLRERRRQMQLARARKEAARQTRLQNPRKPSDSDTRCPISRQHLQTPHVPAIQSEHSQSVPLANTNNSDIFESREALRRAVLAQEILSPPLGLRDQ